MKVVVASPGCGTTPNAATLVPALERMAEAGSAEATYHLGMIYHTGTGVAVDHGKAFALFRRAAANGDPLGAYKVGCYYAGQGEGIVEADPALALKYKLVAAEAGYALAQQDVAAILAARGDAKQALLWLERAVAQGWSGALMMASAVYNGAQGIASDPAKTSAYFRLYLDRVGGDAKQREWLNSYDATLSEADRQRAAALIAAYRPAPIALTLKALSGLRAAQMLVTGAG